MKRIYADFNDIAEDGTLPLTCKGSQSSIANLPGELNEGERVILFDGELTALATVHQRPNGSWEAHSDWQFSR